MEENEPAKKMKVDFSDITEINNLDTARMALRWALERMHALDKLKDELAKEVEREAKLREKSEEDCRALQRSVAIHAAEAHQREAYYKKMEELIALRISGNLDAATLARREVEATQLKEFSQRRQAELEKEYAAKQEGLEKDYQRLREEAQREAETQAKRQEGDFAQLRASLENDYAKKFAALRETEFQLKQRERELSERMTNLEALRLTQRAELDREAKNFQELVEGQLQIRLQSTEKLMQDRQAILERTWAQERVMLLSELAQWEKKSQDQLLELRELERKLAEAEERAHQAQLAPERQAAQFSAQKLALAQDMEALAAQLREWEKKYHEQLPRLLNLETRLSVAEEEAKRAAEHAQREAEERRKAEERSKKQHTRISELELLLADANALAQQARAIPVSQAERFEEERKSWAAERAALVEEVRRLEKRREEEMSRVTELEKRLAESEETTRRAISVAQSQRMRLEERQAAWDKDQAGLLLELSEREKRTREQLPRILELEKRLAEAEESGKRLSEALSMESEARRQAEERERTLSARYEEALKGRIMSLEETFLKREQELLAREKELLKREEDQAKERLAAVRDVEKRLIEQEEAVHESQSLAHTRRLRLEEREAAWDKERTWLLSELAERDSRCQRGLSRILELEKRLAELEESGRRAAEALAVESEARRRGQERERVLVAQWQERLSAVEAQRKETEAAFLKRELELLEQLRQRISSPPPPSTNQ